jgi:hypothetical protein
MLWQENFCTGVAGIGFGVPEKIPEFGHLELNAPGSSPEEPH